jgi:hypothetical protein
MADPTFVNTVARLGPGTITIASKTFILSEYAVGKGLFYWAGCPEISKRGAVRYGNVD